MIKKASEIIGKNNEDSLSYTHEPQNYTPFVDTQNTYEANEDSATLSSYYEDGVMSPVEDDPNEFVLFSDDISNEEAKELSDKGIFVISSVLKDSKFVKNADIRYADVMSNASEIFINKKYENINDYRNILDNFNNNTYNHSFLYIKADKFEHMIYKYADRLNLNVEEIKKDNQNILKINKKSNNKCSAKILSKNSSYTFNCDIANTESLKRLGLQDRDYLKENHAMVFPYENPQPVMFHMGTVKFPIDIIFIDEFNKIKKICSNIQPNTLGTYSCSDISNVLEIPGGYCSKLGIVNGDSVFFSNPKLNKKIASLKNIDSVFALNISDILDVEKTYATDGMKKIASHSLLNSELSNMFSREGLLIKTSCIKKYAKYIKDPNFDKVVVYHSGAENPRSLNIILKNAFNSMGIFDINYDTIRVSSSNINDIYSAINQKFNTDKVFFADNRIQKTADFGIDPEIKSKAKEVIKIYEKTLKLIINLKKDLEQNKMVYEKVKDKFDVIKKSKGQYKQSVKRLSKKYKEILLSIKKGIGIMDEIKDVSNVHKINSSLILSVKNCSDKIKLVFEIINFMDSIEFFQDFSKKTDDCIKIFEDVERNCKRIREFCYADILGKTIISE